MRGGLLWVLVWSLFGWSAQAQEGVVLREQGGLRPGLCGALRIQLSGVAWVRCEPEPGADPLAGRIDQAAAQVRQQGARLGVLLERDPNPGLLRMYIVSARAGQALVAMERIEDRPAPDIDRSLALKVAAAYAMVGAARTAAAQNQLPLAAALNPAGAEPGATWQLFGELGGGAHLSPAGTRGLAALTLGVGQSRGSVHIELGLGARFASRADDTRAPGSVRMRETDTLASLRVLWTGERVELGGVLEALFGVLAAEGTAAADRSRGELRLLMPALALGPDLRIRLFGSAFLRFAPLLELIPREPQFKVDDRVVLRTGVVRATLPLALLVRLPLRAERGPSRTRGLQP